MTVSNIATFGGTATVRSNLTVLAGGALVPGDTNGTPMTVAGGTAVLGANASLVFTAGPTFGFLKLAAGSLSVTAPVQVAFTLAPGCPVGKYPVLDAVAAVGTLQAGDFTLSGTSTDKNRCRLVVEGRVLKLVVAAPGSTVLLR